MGQLTDNNEKTQAVVMISNINRVEGFDPTVLAVDYTDPNGQVYKRLPAMAQMAWFRLKYPEGKIAFSNIIEKAPAGRRRSRPWAGRRRIPGPSAPPDGWYGCCPAAPGSPWAQRN